MKILCESCGPLGANLYLIYNDQGQALLIDPSDAVLAEKKLKSLSLSLSGILFTHAHFDHVAPIAEFKAFTDAPLFIHREDAPLLQNAQNNASFLMGLSLDLGVCDYLFEDNEELILDSFRVRILHTPGHTPGSSCFLVENFLFTGDTLFASDIGRCDLFGGDSAAMQKSLQRLSLLDETLLIYPGHGPCTSLKREKTYNLYLNKPFVI